MTRFLGMGPVQKSASIFISLSYTVALLLFHDNDTPFWEIPHCSLSVMWPPAALIWNRRTPVFNGFVVRFNRLLWKKYYNGFEKLVGMSMQSYSLSCLYYMTNLTCLEQNKTPCIFLLYWNTVDKPILSCIEMEIRYWMLLTVRWRNRNCRILRIKSRIK